MGKLTTQSQIQSSELTQRSCIEFSPRNRSEFSQRSCISDGAKLRCPSELSPRYLPQHNEVMGCSSEIAPSQTRSDDETMLQCSSELRQIDGHADVNTTPLQCTSEFSAYGLSQQSYVTDVTNSTNDISTYGDLSRNGDISPNGDLSRNGVLPREGDICRNYDRYPNGGISQRTDASRPDRAGKLAQFSTCALPASSSVVSSYINGSSNNVVRTSLPLSHNIRTVDPQQRKGSDSLIKKRQNKSGTVTILVIIGMSTIVAKHEAVFFPCRDYFY